MKAAALALSAAVLLPLASTSLQAQVGSPFVETSTLTFYWSFTDSYVANASTPIPSLPDVVTYDPNSLPNDYETFTDTWRARPYTGATYGTFAPAGANQQIISLLLQRMVRDGRVARQALGFRWQLIAVREAPSNVKELATNPYRVFLAGQAGNSFSATSLEAYSFGTEPVVDDPVPDFYFYSQTNPPTDLVTLDTGITITLGQYSGSYTETDFGTGNNRVRKASGSVATAFRVDFGALFYDDPRHAQNSPSVNPYNYHLKRNYWRASAAGLINYNIRTILPPLSSPNVLPAFVATTSSATATGWFFHEYTEFNASTVNNVPVYRTPNPNPNYFGNGIAPLKVALSTIQYQKRDRFDLSIPAAPSTVTTLTVADGSVQVSWGDNSRNETGFYLESSDTPDGPWTQVVKAEASGLFTANFTTTGLNTDSFYYFRVAAFNGGGISDYSDVGVASTALAPSDLDAGPLSSTEVRLRWADNSTVETAYEVQRRRDNTTNWVVIATDVPADATTYDDTTALPSTKYFYRVRAIHDPYGTSAWSNTDDATTTAAPTGGTGG